jgi:P-type Ca2+ transporter type 2C
MKRPLPPKRFEGLAPAAGLTSTEAEHRRQQYGNNDIVEVRRRPWWTLAKETARDPMLWFLALTSGLYLLLGQRLEAGVLILAIVPLIGMDAFLHRRTAASTEGLSARLASRAKVERDGRLTDITASELVPGDVVVVSTGQWFPADGVIMSGDGLQADESSLTGEAFPVAKHALPRLPAGGAEVMIDGEQWGFAGTRLLTGTARMRIVWTGAQTLYGEIVRSALQGSGARTPLQEAVSNLVWVLVIGAAVMCLILAYVRVHQGFGWIDAVLSAVTLAVAAIPEEFPVVFTFFLGVGVYRLAQRQALVRRAVSVENIGRVSCICSDKTGTITEGQLQLTHLVPAKGLDDHQLLTLASCASRADSGDPLDDAINSAAAKNGAPDGVESVAVFPFTESRKRETAVLRQGGGSLLAVTKGAGEVVLQLAQLSADDRGTWTSKMEGYAAEGHKVIGCAWRGLEGEWAGGEPDRGYRWAGFLALEDPVRAGVPEAIQECRAAGIHVVMVTGDHPATAATIAREVGLSQQPHVISGDELDALLAKNDPQRLHDLDVVARAVPAQKLGLVQALQAAGAIVAVTGDGVNDVPALQAADIGIAMGQRGTRSAREVAAIVLLDDNFRSIVRAIGEGQQLFHNLRLSFQYLLMIHVPLVITAALIPLAGFPLLYLPLHIVWLEMIIHPSALLVFQERGPEHRMDDPRGRRQARFFSSRDWLLIALVAAFITTAVAALYVRAVDGVRPVEHARASAMAALTLSSAGLVAGLSRLRTLMSRAISAGTVALTCALVQIGPLSRLFHMEPLHSDDWLLVAAAGVVAMLGAAVAGWDRRKAPV